MKTSILMGLQVRFRNLLGKPTGFPFRYCALTPWIEIALVLLVAGCKYVSDGSCINGHTRQCGSGMGPCAGAVQTCENGEWGACSPAPSVEICDGLDNNCNGEVDEGFFIGLQCELSEGCLGRYACSSNHAASSCVLDRAMYDGGVCPSGNSAAINVDGNCLPHPIDLSEFGSDGLIQGQNAGAPNCQRTSSGQVVLRYPISSCVTPEPYRGCVVARHQDVEEFMRGHGIFAVEICVEGTVDGAVNLWFQDPRYVSSGYLPQGRLSLSIVPKTEPFSSSCRKRWFGVDDIAFPNECPYRSDPNSTECDSLDASVSGSDVDGGTKFSFEDSDIQLVSEWCQISKSGSASSQVSISLTSLEYIPRDCLCHADVDCGTGSLCHKEYWPETACCRCKNSCPGVCY